jgi:hypothetical protein
MTKYEYMCIPLQMLPPPIVERYNLTPLIHNKCVYVKIRKGMYGLPHGGKLANNQLIAALALFRYSPVPFPTSLCKHNSCYITFSVVMNNFSVIHSNKEGA